MADTGYIGMGTAATGSGGGDAAWVNPSNALANDEVFATAAIDDVVPPIQSHNLSVTNGNFSSIPVGATINGIEMYFWAKVTPGTANMRGFFVYRTSDTSWYSLVNNAPAGLTTTLTYFERGGATDLAGVTWTRADIVAVGFGTSIWTNDASGPETVVSVDSIQVKVYYTANPVGGAVNKIVGPYRAAVQRAATI